MAANKITQERLKELLRYDPRTGGFAWLVQRSNIHVGDVAGTLSHGYVTIGVCGIRYRANRLAWFYMTGAWPRDQIDHKDTIRSNNRWKNLRDSTHSINGQNLRKAHRDNQTGHLGVSPFRDGFRATIRFGKKQRHLGTYPTKKEAYAKYLNTKREFHPGCTL